MRLTFEKERLILSSRAPEHGEATIALPAVLSGDPIEIGFNPTFLLDALRVAGASSVQMELKEANRPGVLKVGQEFTYVIMPVSLS